MKPDVVSDGAISLLAEPADLGVHVSRPESVRRSLAPLIALVASAMAMTCTTSLVDLLGQADALAVVNDRFPGWASLGALLSVAALLAALFLSRFIGSGPPLSLGAAAGVFGLAVGHQVVDGLQVSLAFPVLGVAVGCLLGGGLAMTFELPLPWARATLVAWAFPLMAAWPVQSWLALHQPPESLRLSLYPSVWLIAPMSVAIVLWSVATMLLEPAHADVVSDGWEDAWSALTLVFAVVGFVAMLLGFAPEIRLYWLRPLVLVAAALAISGWAMVVLLIPSRLIRLGFVAVSFAAACLPSVVQLLLRVSDDGVSRVSLWAVLALVASAAVGVALGWRWPLSTMTVGLVVVAAASAGTWMIPGRPWLLIVALAPLVAAGATVFAAGLRLAMETPAGLRFVGAAGVGALTLGLLFAAPLGWALAGDLPVSVDDARAAGRVFLGLTGAAAVLLAAYTSVLRGRAVRRAPGAAQPGPLGHHRGVQWPWYSHSYK